MRTLEAALKLEKAVNVHCEHTGQSATALISSLSRQHIPFGTVVLISKEGVNTVALNSTGSAAIVTQSGVEIVS